MEFLTANWQAPKSVIAFSTVREGGVSKPPYHSLNLGLHVGDCESSVLENRQRLNNALPSEPIWLSQIHSNRVFNVENIAKKTQHKEADALYTRLVNQPLAIMTADCLPVFICSTKGDEIAVIHAGWRGLLSGVIENTLACFQSNELVAYFGAAIGSKAFEVGDEVKQFFCTKFSEAKACFKAQPNIPDKHLADIYSLARLTLNKNGVSCITQTQHCTYTQNDLFFSYRRDGVTGRNAHIIYIDSAAV